MVTKVREYSGSKINLFFILNCHQVVINEDNSTMIGPTDLRMNYHYAYIYQHWVR